MIRSRIDILAEVDSTLDQLIENAETLDEISLNSLYQEEVDALQKMQEHLLSHLIHMDELLKTEASASSSDETDQAIREKLLRYGKINASLIERVSIGKKRNKRRGSQSKKPRIHKRKKLISC